MMRSLGLSVVSALMLAQLLLLPTRSMLGWRSSPDHPRMELPVASEGEMWCCGHSHADLSWTREGGWVASGVGTIRTEDLEAFLRTTAERWQGRGYVARMRVRVPGDAPAKHFVYFTKCMERAGISELRVAVVRPDAPWI